ncbi:MAG: ABC transporter ATP-binding protein, partial [Endomicrobium sp.]|nr:ABC transporter ATP-binding protein [Endomicrobium sp.]
TTTVKILTGILRPTSGSAQIFGLDIVKNIDEIKKKTGFVPDQPYIYPYLTAFEYMRTVGDIYGVALEKQKRKIPELFEMFDLKGRSGEIVDSFSHGMKQKLAISSVLLHEPEIMFLDEPLVGLDPKSARLVKDLFKKLSENGVTIFMCTHVLEIAQKLASRICIINEGKILALNTFDSLQKTVSQDADLEAVYLKLTEPDKDA